MALEPAYDDFRAGFEAGRNQLVFARLAADLDTPVSLMLKLTGAQADAFMLESVTGGEVRGRYSIIGMKPDLIWRCLGTTAEINRAARFDREAFEPEAADPLASLRALIAESRIDLPGDLPAASAGLFGYLGYDMIRLVEHLPDVNLRPAWPARRGADAALGRRGARWGQGRGDRGRRPPGPAAACRRGPPMPRPLSG